MSKKWTDEEIQFLKFAYPNKDFTPEEIARVLNRSKGSITSKANLLKLSVYREEIPNGYKKWKSEVEKVMEDNGIVYEADWE